jgi:hypothetical protein
MNSFYFKSKAQGYPKTYTVAHFPKRCIVKNCSRWRDNREKIIKFCFENKAQGFSKRTDRSFSPQCHVVAKVVSTEVFLLKRQLRKLIYFLLRKLVLDVSKNLYNAAS